MRRQPLGSRPKTSSRESAGGNSKPRKASKGDSKRPSQDVLALEVETFLRVCEAVDTPRSLACFILASSGTWEQYLELSFPDPLHPRFPDDYLVTEMMTKNPRLPLTIDREAVAKGKFLESEVMCANTNRRLAFLGREPDSNPKMSEQVFRLQRIISDALGPLTASVLARVTEASRFGPGSTSNVSGADVCLSRKYASDVLDATPRMVPYAAALFGPHVKGAVTHVTASKVTVVPKNAKTDRTICIEPHCNVYLQLGIGAALRHVLRKLGLQPDLQERNREMARTAVKCGYATIDLSMASDTIARRLVDQLIPPDWLQLLYVARTDQTTMDGRTFTLEKFSSMGNGFTWELESLIFWAMCKLHTDEDIGVFGDDLVLPIESVSDVVESLEFFGFKTNTKKSFWQGPFRESCGTDWWHGLDIRPIYLRKADDEIFDRKHYSVHIANSLRFYAHRRGDRVFCDRLMLRPWLYAKSRCGEYSRTAIAYGYGDDGLIKNFDEATPSRNKRYHLWRGIVAKRSPVDHRGTSEEGAYLAALNKGTPEGSRLLETQRKRLRRPATKVVLINHWYDLGPWL